MDEYLKTALPVLAAQLTQEGKAPTPTAIAAELAEKVKDQVIPPASE